MEQIVFYGASDDLIEVEGNIRGCDEYPSEHARFVLCGLFVEVFYGSGGVWNITVGMLDEDIPVSAENIKLSQAGYSMKLSLEVPEGSYIVREEISAES